MNKTFTTRTLATVLFAGTTLLSGAAAVAQSTSTASTGNMKAAVSSMNRV